MDKQVINNTGFLPTLLLSVLLLGAFCYSSPAGANEVQRSVPQVTAPQMQLAYYGWRHHRHWRHYHRCPVRCYINRWGHRRCFRRC